MNDNGHGANFNKFFFEFSILIMDGFYDTVLDRYTKTKFRGLSPHANYTDRAAAAGRRS